MEVYAFIQEVRELLKSTFAGIDAWFDADPVLRGFRPGAGGWTIDRILEHISLTNHFLLILIDKGATKAQRQAGTMDLAELLASYRPQQDKLTEVGLHRSFPWIRPEHMEPKGARSNDEVRLLLNAQLERCLTTLDALPNGEGILAKTTMSVNSLGKIDVYEYLMFLAQHGKRHLMQMRKNEAEFMSKSA